MKKAFIRTVAVAGPIVVVRHIVDVLVVADIAAKGHVFPVQAVVIGVIVIVLHEVFVVKVDHQDRTLPREKKPKLIANKRERTHSQMH